MLYTHKSFGEHKIGAMSSIYIHTPTTYSIFSRFQRPLRILLLLLITTSVGRGVVARGGIYSIFTVNTVIMRLPPTLTNKVIMNNFLISLLDGVQ